MSETKERVPIMILIVIVLVIVLIGLIFIFFKYIYPNVQNWGWSAQNRSIEPTIDMQLLRESVESCLNSPAGCVVLKICNNFQGTGSCQIELEFDGAWKVRPYEDIEENNAVSLISSLPFLEVSNSYILRSENAGKINNPEFFKKWYSSNFQVLYKELVTSLISNNFENGIDSIINFVNKNSGGNMHLEIEKRRFEENIKSASTKNLGYLRINAVIPREEMNKKKIIEFTQDYLKFAKIFDSSKENYYESRRINLVFLTKPEKENADSVNSKAGGGSFISGMILYSDDSLKNSNDISQMIKSYNKDGRKYYFVKGNVANNFFSHMSQVSAEILGDAGSSVAENDKFSYIRVSGNAESDPSINAEFSKIVIDGEVFTKQANSPWIGGSMKNSELIIGSIKGVNPFLGSGMVSSKIRIINWQGEWNSSEIKDKLMSEVWMKGKRVFPAPGSLPWESGSKWISPIFIVNLGYGDDLVLAFYNGGWIAKLEGDSSFKSADQWCNIAADPDKKNTISSNTIGGEAAAIKEISLGSDYVDGLGKIVQMLLDYNGYSIRATKLGNNAAEEKKYSKSDIDKAGVVAVVEEIVKTYSTNNNQNLLNRQITGFKCGS